jgi:hypothetical protein
MAKAKGCDGIICGHIHKAETRMIDGIHYLNSGDWVETMSALAEDHDGNWQVIYYSEIKFKRTPITPLFENKEQEETKTMPLRSVSFDRVPEDLTPPTIRF